MHAYNPSTWEVEAKAWITVNALSSATKQVWGQLGMHETLFQRKTKTEKKELYFSEFWRLKWYRKIEDQSRT